MGCDNYKTTSSSSQRKRKDKSELIATLVKYFNRCNIYACYFQFQVSIFNFQVTRDYCESNRVRV